MSCKGECVDAIPGTNFRHASNCVDNPNYVIAREKHMTTNEWRALGLLCKEEADRYGYNTEEFKRYKALADKCFTRETALNIGVVMP